MYKQYVTAEKRGSNIAVETLSIAKESTEQVGPKDKLVSFSYCRVYLGNLLGKTLTVIDSAISESRQNKATKDLIKQAFGETLQDFTEELIDQEVACAMADAAVAKMSEKEVEELEKSGVDITEVLGIEN